MTPQTFPEHLKECYRMIFKLVCSNSGQLKQIRCHVPLLLPLKSKTFICHIISRSNSENRARSESTGLSVPPGTSQAPSRGSHVHLAPWCLPRSVGPQVSWWVDSMSLYRRQACQVGLSRGTSYLALVHYKKKKNSNRFQD